MHRLELEHAPTSLPVSSSPALLQLDAFQAAFAGATGGRTTNRQIMPVNGRTILRSEN